jgi:hypothetical protein
VIAHLPDEFVGTGIDEARPSPQLRLDEGWQGLGGGHSLRAGAAAPQTHGAEDAEIEQMASHVTPLQNARFTLAEIRVRKRIVNSLDSPARRHDRLSDFRKWG